MRRRAWLAGVAAAAALVVVSGSVPGPAASAGPSTQGSATSRTAQTDAGTTQVTSNVTLLGLSLGGLVTNNLVNQFINLPQTLTASLANALAGPGLSATNGTTQQPRPTSGGYPTCGQGGWTTSNCFGPVVPGVSGAGPVTLTTGGVQGYATGDDAGYAAATHVANPNLTLFGVSIGDLGVVDSTASCTPSACIASHTLTGGSLFNGGLTYSLAGNTVLAQVGNVAVTSVPVDVVKNVVTAALSGNLLTITVKLDITQLLGGIGTTLSALGGVLGGTLSDVGTTATLTLTVGPGQVTTNNSSASSAWGLNVGVSLAADIKLKLGLLTSIGVSVGPATAGSPDLTNIRLAYSATTAGTGGPGGPGDPGSLLPGWISPALV